MIRRTTTAVLLGGVLVWAGWEQPAAQQAVVSADERAGCEALLLTRNLTLTYAGVQSTGQGAAYCYVKGILPPAIGFHVQLPFPDD